MSMVFLAGDGKPNVRGDGDNEEFCPDALNCEGEVVDSNPSLPEWEQGGNLKCFSGDTSCYSDPAVFCYRGFNGTASNCEGKGPAKNFASELSQLDVLETVRLAIGVGASSDTSVGSAVWLIDNNPNKIAVDLEPRQVMNADDLIYALKELCHENTPNPTSSPTAEAAPTSEPCPSDVVIGPRKGETDFTDLPIQILDRDEHTVTVEITSPLTEVGSLSWLFTQYQKDHIPYCEGWEDWTPTSSFIVTAECMSHTPIAIIEVFVFDGAETTEYLDFQLDRADVPECCHAPEGIPVVRYAFKGSMRSDLH